MREDPAQIAERVARRLGPIEGPPEPLSGGITNRNFRVRVGGQDYVVRVPGQDTELLGIDRRAEHQAARAAASVGIGPEVALFAADEGCLVTRFVAARPLSGRELGAPGTLELAARALRAFHGTGPLPTTFNVCQIGRAYRDVALARGVSMPVAYEAAARCAQEIDAALRGPEHEPVPCHNDLLTANFLLDGDRLWIVDWEYAGMGDRYFDLGNLAVNNELDESEEERLLAAYFDEPPSPGRLACLRLMRIASDFREAMWGVAQQGLSDLHFDFVAYADDHFARLLEAAGDPRYEQWLQEAYDHQTA
ncbi:MAG TPA: phosphotransferase [Solirubrobacteraceae bacterium]|nr:phosphotransferase [Solirubrobacteraceae bacterium]